MNIRSFSDMNRENGGDSDGDGNGSAGNFAEYEYSRRVPPTRLNSFQLSGQNAETYIFHELQQSALCGQHCCNNLLQNHTFSEFDLAEIAQQLDAQERSLGLGIASGESSNVDASGNFSIQVLRRALQQSNGIELVSWSGEAGRDVLNFDHEEGFIVNRREHWFAIRKIRGKWYNLNSTSPRPEVISDFYVEAFLGQLRAEQYTVFLCKGNPLPAAGSLPVHYDRNSDGKYWLKESDLHTPHAAFEGSSNQQSTEDGKPKAMQPFSGRGNRLDGGGPSQSGTVGADGSTARSNSNSNRAMYGEDGAGVFNGIGSEDEDPELAAAIAASLGQEGGAGPGGGQHGALGPSDNIGGSSYEDDLARAIALSQQDTNGGGGGSNSAPVATEPAKTPQQIMREARLAAFAKKK